MAVPGPFKWIARAGGQKVTIRTTQSSTNFFADQRRTAIDSRTQAAERIARENRTAIIGVARAGLAGTNSDRRSQDEKTVACARNVPRRARSSTPRLRGPDGQGGEDEQQGACTPEPDRESVVHVRAQYRIGEFQGSQNVRAATVKHRFVPRVTPVPPHAQSCDRIERTERRDDLRLGARSLRFPPRAPLCPPLRPFIEHR